VINQFLIAKQQIRETPRRWLVTGVAGFIGSHLLHFLLENQQTVIGVDNLATGYRHNLERVKQIVGEDEWGRFTFLEGDIVRPETCETAFATQVDHVLHQAALGSVPRSLANPLNSNAANITGFVNVLWSAKQNHVSSFVYAASSSTYGDETSLPKVEDRIGKPLSPYALTKYVNELYADVFDRCYGMKATGLRYFNVFGPRQDPAGAHAAVIPRWIQAMLSGDTIVIHGDGETSRDFCFIRNVIQANILAALAPPESSGQVYNIAVGQRTTLNELHRLLEEFIRDEGVSVAHDVTYADFRPGDVRHSLADISKAQQQLGYCPSHTLPEGLRETVQWFIKSGPLVKSRQ